MCSHRPSPTYWLKQIDGLGADGDRIRGWWSTQAGVRKVYMPRGNAEQMMALPEYPGSGLEVVAMVSLLDHIADILSPMP